MQVLLSSLVLIAAVQASPVEKSVVLQFSGLLVFLNSYEYIIGESLLAGLGVATEFTSGIQFWNCHDRTLYNASVAQLACNSSFPNSTARAKPVFRTKSQSRIHNSEISWALGFFGPSFSALSNPTFANFANAFDVVHYAPPRFTFATNDAYAMQSICAYESGYIGVLGNTLDVLYYYDYSWGNPTGRTQGIGFIQELLARLQIEYIFSSNTSVNSTRHFILSRLTPFSARLVTEVIGCADENPSPNPQMQTQYYPTQCGYDPANASNKFVRMRLNSGIVPLSTIRGGACGTRSDGLCPLSSFLESQTDWYTLSNYDYACFGNYTLPAPANG
ncbi:phosphoglycerate mutase-like protein [Lepidopterella palustris CBS 459.81]|uniref:Phosphoglycerate mutase-like protein n=1 Tax=Lepidopterella palustris CBS 459.81 TaxID=1314670 RepID=A0A8E2E7E8_9PEZI|nr:phosphoglycerate mutase-like protein [Lepidopterella palustris CBS 459.81]